MTPQLSVDEVEGFLAEVFPQIDARMKVEAIGAGTARVRYHVRHADLRPGDTVSGPSMFTLADCAYYVVTLAHIGREALTVTTSCTINFMRKPAPHDMIAEARILKLGKTMSVGDVLIYSEGQAAPVAQASLTYAIPPKRASDASR